MKEIDKFTPPIVMTICWRAFNHHGKDEVANVELVYFPLSLKKVLSLVVQMGSPCMGGLFKNFGVGFFK
jgi:hypothetical protein